MKKLIAQARTTEVGDLANRLVTMSGAEAKLQKDSFLKDLFTDLGTYAARITIAIHRDTAFSHLEEADARRDALVRSLYIALNGYRALPVDAMRTNAEPLFAIFSKYGVKIVNESYSNESALIEALLSDLSAPELQANIAALPGVQEIISNLRAEQTNFNTLRIEYEKQLSEQRSAENASTIKTPMVDLINKKLIPYLQAMEMANADLYKAFAEAADQAVATTNTAIVQRQNNAKAAAAKAKTS